MQRLIIAIIRIYQKTLSRLIGNQCRFYPTCSEYSILAIKKHGSLKGIWLTARRLSRCTPLCDGGCDNVPELFFWFKPTQH